MKAAACLTAMLAGSALTGCASSSGSAVAPSLADPPAGLIRDCDDPVRLSEGAANPAGAGIAQGAIVRLWAQDRAALVACKGRHRGLRAFYAARDQGLRG